MINEIKGPFSPEDWAIMYEFHKKGLIRVFVVPCKPEKKPNPLLDEQLKSKTLESTINRK